MCSGMKSVQRVYCYQEICAAAPGRNFDRTIRSVLKTTLLILCYFNALAIRVFRSAIHCVSADNTKQETSLIGSSKIKNLMIMTCYF